MGIVIVDLVFETVFFECAFLISRSFCVDTNRRYGRKEVELTVLPGSRIRFSSNRSILGLRLRFVASALIAPPG